MPCILRAGPRQQGRVNISHTSCARVGHPISDFMNDDRDSDCMGHPPCRSRLDSGTYSSDSSIKHRPSDLSLGENMFELTLRSYRSILTNGPPWMAI